jgi:hypothetical protein
MFLSGCSPESNTQIMLKSKAPTAMRKSQAKPALVTTNVMSRRQVHPENLSEGGGVVVENV